MYYVLGFNTFYFFVYALLNYCLGILPVINVVKYAFYCITNTATGHWEIIPRLLGWLITEGTSYPRGKTGFFLVD